MVKRVSCKHSFNSLELIHRSKYSPLVPTMGSCASLYVLWSAIPLWVIVLFSLCSTVILDILMKYIWVICILIQTDLHVDNYPNGRAPFAKINKLTYIREPLLQYTLWNVEFTFIKSQKWFERIFHYTIYSVVKWFVKVDTPVVVSK